MYSCHDQQKRCNSLLEPRPSKPKCNGVSVVKQASSFSLCSVSPRFSVCFFYAFCWIMLSGFWFTSNPLNSHTFIQHSFHFTTERTSITGQIESCSGESHINESVWPTSNCVCICVYVCVVYMSLLCVCECMCACVSLTLAGPCPQWWLWVPTSSATRFPGWHLASGLSARVARTPSLLWAKVLRWASMSVNTSSDMDAGTVQRWEKGQSSARSCE